MDAASSAAWVAALVAFLAAAVALWQGVSAKRQVNYAKEQLEILKEQHRQEVLENERQRRRATFNGMMAVISAVDDIVFAFRSLALDLQSDSVAGKTAMERIRELLRQLDIVYLSGYVPVSRDADELDGLLRQLRYGTTKTCEHFIEQLPNTDSSANAARLASETADVLQGQSFEVQAKVRVFAGQKDIMNPTR